MKETKIALGTWSWGLGAVGGDQVFGNHLEKDNLKPVFDAAIQAGLNVWDTATVYGMGASESILGELAKAYPRQEVVLSTKFTPQMGQTVEEMESSGIAARIRAVEGCLGYEYFFPADDPNGLLLIDSWENQEALNRYHSSPAMTEAAALREKYGLGGRTVRMFTPVTPPRRQESENNNNN